MNFVTIDIRSLVVKDRIRKEMGDLVELADSLESVGQIQPIVIHNNELKAGGRRYAATALLLSEERSIGGKLPDGDSRKLEPGHILAVQFSDLDRKTQILIEIEENTRRKEFSKAEEALGFKRLSELMTELEGTAPSVKEIARVAGVSAATVSMGMRVADAVDAAEKAGDRTTKASLLAANSVKGAYDKLRAQEGLKNRIAQIKQNIPKEDLTKGLVNADALTWLPTLANASVDLWLFDPPWGIGIDDYDRAQKYDSDWADDRDHAQKLMGAMLPELYRTLADNSWMVTFFGIQFYQEYKSLLEKSGFKVYPVPYIWYKPNKAGAQNDPSRFDINQWEPIFLCAKGEPRIFKQAQGNVLSYNMPSRTDRFHFAQKPVELYSEMIERWSYGNMLVADPTAGSFASIRAAKLLGRNYIACEKDKENYDQGVIFVNQFA